MTPRLLALAAVAVAFGLLTARALADYGYIGLIAFHLSNWGSAQVLTDLAIIALLACLWMIHDSRGRNLPAWPFVLITLAAGSFGVLFYLMAREWRAKQPR